jgi:CubicO group peptidase (beta-lactamase class C family)
MFKFRSLTAAIAGSTVLSVVLVALFTATTTIAQQAVGPAVKVGQSSLVPPESVGLAPDRLARITTSFQKEVADKKLPGAVAMIARKGRLAYSETLGVRDPNGTDPMRSDAIFRIYSMTKPMASVAAMILFEDGVLQLTDPVSKWLPAFKDVKVSSSGGDVAPGRAITVHDLLRHTAGLAYGELTQNASVKDALAQAGLFKPGVIAFDARDMTGAEQVERLARIPLIHQPGTVWEYSLAYDLLGRVVEAASGKRLGDFLRERLFQPLGMVDTAFWVPEAKRTRVAEAFAKDPLSNTAITLIDVSKQPGNDSGGGGVVSTAPDYLRFTQMLLNGGVLDGHRVLSRTTIRLMTSDHLGSRLPAAPTVGGRILDTSSFTFGLGFSVRLSDGMVPFPGSAGEFAWAGFAGTEFWVDPKEQLVAVFMVQSGGPLRNYHRNLFRQLVYQAIAD